MHLSHTTFHASTSMPLGDWVFTLCLCPRCMVHRTVSLSHCLPCYFRTSYSPYQLSPSNPITAFYAQHFNFSFLFIVSLITPSPTPLTRVLRKDGIDMTEGCIFNLKFIICFLYHFTTIHFSNLFRFSLQTDLLFYWPLLNY